MRTLLLALDTIILGGAAIVVWGVALYMILAIAK